MTEQERELAELENRTQEKREAITAKYQVVDWRVLERLSQLWRLDDAQDSERELLRVSCVPHALSQRTMVTGISAPVASGIVQPVE